jgi:hypothetical protein
MVIKGRSGQKSYSSTYLEDRIKACDASIGDYDVYTLMRGVLLRGFEDCELLRPDTDITF